MENQQGNSKSILEEKQAIAARGGGIDGLGRKHRATNGNDVVSPSRDAVLVDNDNSGTSLETPADSSTFLSEKQRLASRGGVGAYHGLRATSDDKMSVREGATAVRVGATAVGPSDSIFLPEKQRIASLGGGTRGLGNSESNVGANAIITANTTANEDCILAEQQMIAMQGGTTRGFSPPRHSHIDQSSKDTVYSNDVPDGNSILAEKQRIAMRGGNNRGLSTPRNSYTDRSSKDDEVIRSNETPDGNSMLAEKQRIASRGHLGNLGTREGSNTGILAEKQKLASRGSRDDRRMVQDAACGVQSNEVGAVLDVDKFKKAVQPSEHTGSETHDVDADDTNLICAKLVDEEDVEKNLNDLRQQLIEEAVVATEVMPETWWQKYKIRILCCWLTTVVVVAAIVLGFTLSKKEPEPLTGYDYLVELISSISSEEVLLDQSTPQNKALNWLAFEDRAKIPQDSSSAIVLTERYVVALLHFANGGSAWPDHLDFLSNSSVCEWPPIQEDESEFFNAVRCDSNNEFVNYIRLDYNNLTGTIVPELSALKSLTLLSLRGNQLSGTLPPALGDLPRLALLAFPENALSGFIPNSLAKLEALETLALSHNLLSGTIPSNLTKIGVMRLLALTGNSLTGPIPEFLPRSALETLDLSFNQLGASIPESLFSLKSMEYLFLDSNFLTGTISSKIRFLTKLTEAYFGDNEFSGVFPTELSNLADLVVLNMERNKFSGPIPSQFGQLPKLQTLAVSENVFSGSLPSALGQATNLVYLGVQANLLTGTIPPALLELKGLTDGFLGLHNNSFTGSLDPLFCNASLFSPSPRSLTADCKELECSCCTDCCDDLTGDCVISVDKVCGRIATDFESLGTAAGTNCSCLMVEEGNGSMDLSCKDTECEICNSEGTACIENQDYGFDFTPDGSDHRWRCSMKHSDSSRQQDSVITWHWDLMFSNCSATIDGTQCQDCLIQYCNDGEQGSRVDCSNVEEGAVYDDCDSSLNGGGLLWMFNPEYRDSDCYPCIYGPES